MDCEKIKYPIYIVSKGRWENPLTAKFLLKEKIHFNIAVEPQEFDNYCRSIPKEFVKCLPFKNMGLGSFPARNWCWEDSLRNGFQKHFIFDDNIYGMIRLNKGKRARCEARLAILTLQNFTEKFINVPLSGFNYSYFVTK